MSCQTGAVLGRHLLERRAAIFDLALLDRNHRQAIGLTKLGHVGQRGVDADRAGYGRFLGKDRVRGHCDEIAAGSGQAAHRDDQWLRRTFLLIRALPKLGEAVMQIVAGGDRAAGAVDPQHNRFYAIVLSRLVNLPMNVAIHPFEYHPIKRNDRDFVLGIGRARVIVFRQRDIAGFRIRKGVERSAETGNENQSREDKVEEHGDCESTAGGSGAGLGGMP